MKKSTKGALAAGAAAAILLGGAGTLAYWTAETEVNAGTIEAGSIELTSEACDGWKYVEGDLPVTTFVPGDVVYNDCGGELVLEGDNIGATLQVDEATFAGSNGDFGGELTAAVELLDDADQPIPTEIVGAGTYAGTLRTTVTWAYGTVTAPDPRTGTDNDFQNAVATLNTVDVVATQTNTND